MKVTIYICVIVTFIFNALASSEDILPPDAQAFPVKLVNHQDVRIDEYYWLRDIDNPAVITYLEAENYYTERVMAGIEGLREEIQNELLARIPQHDESAHFLMNGYYYYTVYEEDKEYPLWMRREEYTEYPEELLLDLNLLADGYSYFSLHSFEVSPDNRIMAFSVDTMSSNQCTIFFKDLVTGEMLDDRVLNTSSNIAWANDSRTFFFERLDNTHITDRIMRGHLGTTDEETVLYQEDPSFWPYLHRSRSGGYILVDAYNKGASEVWYLDTDNPDGDFTVVQPRTENLVYRVYPSGGGQFYIQTNYEAENYRLMRAHFESPLVKNWVEVIPHREDVFLESLEVFRGFVVLTERSRGSKMLRVINSEERSDHYIYFGEKNYVVNTNNNYEFDTDLFQFAYSTMVTPWSTFEYNMSTHERTLLYQQEIPGGYDASLYHSTELWVTVGDEISIPISLVYRKDLFHPGENPLLLEGYGAFGHYQDREFNWGLLSLLDRGFVYAFAHVRGGGGGIWYGGMLLNKINSFTDFIACAEYLINEGYCNRDFLFAYGSSAGGLLMGAVVNMRPDLWRGVIADVPFVDVVTTMLDETIPLTNTLRAEFGNPDYPIYYKYMLAYSPYDNIRETDYPAMLVFAGLHDSQVGYWEPAKWVARLRDMKTDDNVLLLYTDMNSGHEGASGRIQWIDRSSMISAFILDLARP